MELCELILLLVGPQTCSGIAVIDGISRGVVPTTELRGKREILPQVGAVRDETNRFGRTFCEKRVDAKLGYVLGERLHVDAVYSRAVELIENHDLQEYMGGFRVAGKLRKE